MIIAIDGPAATGKSTTARFVAQKLGFTYLDTGAMYRSVTLAVLRENLELDDQVKLNSLLERIDINLEQRNGKMVVFLNGDDVSGEIRSAEVTANVSAVSAKLEVRIAMVRSQRKIAAKANCVIEGRDIGTVVFPDAEFKFFLVTDDEVRATRRLRDLQKIGESKSIDELVTDIRQRDAIDSSRDISPLIKAKDAIEIDTTKLTIDEQVSKIIEIINNKQNINVLEK